MPVSRRSFLKSAATTALTASFSLHAAPLVFGQNGTVPVPFEAQQSPLFYFKRETFEPYVGGTFRVSAGRTAVEMKLKEVRDLTASAASSRVMKASQQTDSFALVFSSGKRLPDLTTIYDVEHAGLGRFSVFLTGDEGAPDARVYFYEAVFNHFR